MSESATPWTVARQAPLSLGILQARILKWVAISFSRGSSQPRDQTQVSRIVGGFFTIWVTRKAPNIYFTVPYQVLVAAYGIQFPDQEWNPGPQALGVQDLSHWTSREVPR